MTDRDIIREVAESKCIIDVGEREYCRYCDTWGWIVTHDDDCLWVYCVEKMKEREDGRINK
jgi:hypothetical protein